MDSPDRDPHFDLEQWCMTFLTSKGINYLLPSLEERDGKLFLILKQERGRFSDGLRSQKVDVALYNRACEEDLITVMVREDMEETAIPLEKRKLDDTFVIPNAGDHAYLLVMFDKRSIEFFENNISVLENFSNYVESERRIE